MITKKVPNPDKAASVDTRVSTLLAYVRAPQTENAEEKCTYYGARGFLAVDPDEHAQEMIDLARAARRSPDPIIHYVLSWPEDERPTPAQVEDAVDLFMDELDSLPKPPKLRADHTWRDHQWVFAVHEDTDNIHVHLIGNRVDPHTDRAIKINRGFDVDAGIRASARIEHVQGWKPEPNKRYRIAADGSVVRASAGDRDAARRPPQHDLRMEGQTGRPSATRIAIDRALPIIARAQTWAKVHEGLDAVGMRYARAGPGAVVMAGDVPVKASRVDGAVTLDALVERLGPFSPAGGAAPEPTRPTDIAPRIAHAQSWADVHRELASVGATYEAKGSGAIVRTADREWKASDLGRGASRHRLEQRLGPFEAAGATPADTARDVAPAPAPADPTAATAAIEAANTWPELHAKLDALGCAYQRKGSGAVVRAGDDTWKASAVSRHATLARLERRLGPFEPPAPAPETEPTTEPTTAGAALRSEFEAAAAAAIAQQRRDTEAERAQHDQEIARIDHRARDEHDEIARLFPRPPPPPPRAKPRDNETPSPPDDDAARAAAAQAREARIIHHAVTLAFARKARRERARENRRYRRVMSAIRSRYERTTTYLAWLVDRGPLAPPRGWDQPEPDAILRPVRTAEYVPPERPLRHVSGTLDPYTVGRRVDYPDDHGDVACSDLGPHLVVRRPSDITHHLIGVDLARAKWGRETQIEAVDLPPPGEARGLMVGSVRPIVDIAAEIDALRQIVADGRRAVDALPDDARTTPDDARLVIPAPAPAADRATPAPKKPRRSPRHGEIDRYQRPPMFEGRGGSPAVPRDIRGYEARVDGERVLYRRRGAPSGTPDAFRDVGPRIDVLDWQSEESTLAALELSAAKWGEFVVTGNEEFKSRCARLAAEHGFQITNPELQESIERERARLGAAANVSVDPEPSPEPDVEPGGTPGRTPPAVDPPAGTRDSEPDDAPVPAPPILDAEADAVRLVKEFVRLREKHGELHREFMSDTYTLRFLDHEGNELYAAPESVPAVARMEALLRDTARRIFRSSNARSRRPSHGTARRHSNEGGEAATGDRFNAVPEPGTREARGTARGASARTQRAAESRERRIQETHRNTGPDARKPSTTARSDARGSRVSIAGRRP